MTQHNDTESTLESSFNDWVLGHELPEQVLMQLQMHPVWSERMLAYSQLESMAEQVSHEPVQVPTWQKTQGFEQHLKQQSWWQQQRLSLFALTFSVFACVILLFDLRVNLTEGGLTIATADALQNQKLEKQFAQLAQQNNALIQTRLDNFQANQQQSTAQLVSYVLNNSRLERQEDIQDVVEVIQQQRKDDLIYLKQQFNDISYRLRQAQFSPKGKDRNAALTNRESFITE